MPDEQPSSPYTTADRAPSSTRSRSSLIQPLVAGILSSVVGFSSSFSIVLQGLDSVGATPAQAASGLFMLCIAEGLLAIYLSLRHRQPISIAWSTPGAALLMGSGIPNGGFGVAVCAFLMTGLLIIIAGIWRPLARAVAAIPLSIASAMLAGILMGLCLAPAHAAAQMPMLALPIIIAWLLAWLLIRRYAVLVALIVTVIVVAFSISPSSHGVILTPPPITFVTPVFDLMAAASIAVPLFVVTMASQNVPGVAVMRSNGYEIPMREAFISTGTGSAITALFGGHVINLSAITAALCAGPEAGEDHRKRYLASVAGGVTYILLGLGAGVAASFVTLSPPLLIETLAGLALLSSLGGALTTTLANEQHRLAALITFIVTASSISVIGLGAAFWGLIAGGMLLMAENLVCRFKAN